MNIINETDKNLSQENDQQTTKTVLYKKPLMHVL